MDLRMEMGICATNMSIFPTNKRVSTCFNHQYWGKISSQMLKVTQMTSFVPQLGCCSLAECLVVGVTDDDGWCECPGITSPTPSADGVLDLCQQPRSADMTASSMISHCENSFQIANFLMSNADLSEKPLDELPSAKLFESVQLFSPNWSSFASGIWWLWYTDVDSHRVISCYIAHKP